MTSIEAMDRLRLISASVALAIPVAVFALNALISFRERGIVEPLDIPAAIAFAVLAALVWRGSRIGLFCAALLVVAYLVTAAVGGVTAFVVYWVAALILALQALPVTGELRARSAV
jgi:hypothetical protein